jgi:hypothetical protein
MLVFKQGIMKFKGYGFLLLLLLFSIFSACKKTIVQDKVYDNVIYDMGNKVVYGSAAEKNKQKTPTQFISILYADLKQTGISNNELNELGTLNLAMGDKGLLNELLISHYMNNPGVLLPTNNAMRANIDQFIEDTFIRFYQRKPSAYEKYYFKNYITQDASVTPELVYSAFALSDEYWFY